MAAFTEIDDPEAYFQTVIYTGGQSGGGMKTQAVTFDGENDMSPNMVWIKSRSNTYAHVLADSVRGVDEILHPNTNDDALDGVADSSGGVSVFGSNGFTAAGNDVAWVAESPSTYVAWCWKESATAGFDIVLYTGNETARTISHSLSAVPKVIMPKARSTDGFEWRLYHAGNTSAPETDYLILNENYATADGLNVWNDTAPTSSVFTLGDGETPNDDGTTYVAYLWAEKQGFSKFGKYTGNGNADGAFIYLGFKPAWFLCKNTQDAGDNWILHDNKRDPFNVTDNGLAPNSTTAEFTDVDMDFLSNGVKMRNNTGRANSVKTFVYMAFAESPFCNSNGVPNNAK